MKNKLLVLTLLAAMLVVPWVAGAATVVAPNGLEAVEGNSNNSFPFSTTNATSMRYQQVYGAGEFSSVAGPFYVTGMTFRLDGVHTVAWSGTSSDIELRFSTTSRAVDGLSTTFASNVGANELTVYNASLTLSSTPDGPPGGPHDFDIQIIFSTPYLYNPSGGNLLLDVFNRGGNSVARSFDAQNTFGDGISRVFSSQTGSVDDPTGLAATAGLVTQFTVTPIPEPRVLSLALLAGGTLGLRHWRRAFRARPPVCKDVSP